MGAIGDRCRRERSGRGDLGRLKYYPGSGVLHAPNVSSRGEGFRMRGGVSDKSFVHIRDVQRSITNGKLHMRLHELIRTVSLASVAFGKRPASRWF